MATQIPGGPQSLRTAFEVHYLPTLRLCLLLSGRREEAEDIAQEAFVRLAPRLEVLDEAGVGPYVRRIAVNLWKNNRRRVRIELRARQRLGPHAGPEEPSSAAVEPVWQAIRRLPPRQRACVVLRYYEDLPEREVASVLGCSRGTVKSQTSRALARLRKELGDED